MRRNHYKLRNQSGRRNQYANRYLLCERTCPIGRAWRDAPLNTIGAGVSEIMKEIIAKDAKL
jgi:alkylation response protein AidB-like acyl-CoA dehydrogenase